MNEPGRTMASTSRARRVSASGSAAACSIGASPLSPFARPFSACALGASSGCTRTESRLHAGSAMHLKLCA